MIAVQEAETLPARGDVLQADPAVVPGVQLVLEIHGVGALDGSLSRRTRAPRGARYPSANGGSSRGAPMEELAVLAVTTTAGFLEEAAHRQPPTRLVRKGTRVPELALALNEVFRHIVSNGFRFSGRVTGGTIVL